MTSEPKRMHERLDAMSRTIDKLNKDCDETDTLFNEAMAKPKELTPEKTIELINFMAEEASLLKMLAYFELPQVVTREIAAAAMVNASLMSGLAALDQAGVHDFSKLLNKMGQKRFAGDDGIIDFKAILKEYKEECA
jgi:hypothetical protein